MITKKQIAPFYLIRQLVVILLGTQLFFISTFTALSVPVAEPHNLVFYLHNLKLKIVHHIPPSFKSQMERAGIPFPNVRARPCLVRYMYYVPEVPAAILAGYILGPYRVLIAVLLFLLGGLIGPAFKIYPFAAGGGWTYYQQPGFGYLMGLLPASVLSGWLTAQVRTSFRQLLAVLGGVLLVHLCGVTWMLISCLVSVLPPWAATIVPDWHPWLLEEIFNLSICPLPWDFLFSLAVIGFGFPLRWLIKTLTAEDVSVKDEAISDKALQS